jgi:hypothetical protein
MIEKEGKKNVQKTHSLFLCASFFYVLCVDDKKMERLFSSVPPSHIKKSDRDITIADR